MKIDQASQNEVIVFARSPELGKCKTRLAVEFGNENALIIYKALLKHTLEQVGLVTARKVLCLDPHTDVDNAPTWAPGMDLYIPQSHGDLGNRLSRAVEGSLERKSKKIILIGSDCPQITKDSLDSAFSALENFDIVLGPTDDGGYYLLGLKQSHPSLFEEIPWSTEFVLEKTINILKIQSFSYIALPTLSDVDTPDDFRRMQHLEPLKYLGIR